MTLQRTYLINQQIFVKLTSSLSKPDVPPRNASRSTRQGDFAATLIITKDIGGFSWSLD